MQTSRSSEPTTGAGRADQPGSSRPGATALVLACVSLCLSASSLSCATRGPITEWGYSSWFRRGGTGEMGTFERQRDTCLSQVGIADPSAVASGSAEEDRFIRCMNAANWCTRLFGCDKPAT